MMLRPIRRAPLSVSDKTVLAQLTSNQGATSLPLRRKLAQIAYARTAAYDAAVTNWLAGELAKAGDTKPPRRRTFAGTLHQKLRYGVNPHQHAAFYATASGCTKVSNGSGIFSGSG